MPNDRTLVIVAAITIVPATISAIGSWQAKELAEETHAIVVPLADTVVEVKKQTDGLLAASNAANRQQGQHEGEKMGVAKGVAAERLRAATAQANQERGARAEAEAIAAREAAKHWWQR